MLDSSFIDPSGQSLYSLDAMHNMVFQLPNKENKESISMGGFANETGAPTSYFLKRDSPPKKKRVPWNKGRKGYKTSKRITFASPYILYYLHVTCGWTGKQIAEKYNVNPCVVYARMKEWGIPRINRTKFYPGHKTWNTGTKGLVKSWNKGKTWEECYGEKRARELKELQSEKKKGHISHNKGKTMEESYGEERAKAIKKKMSEIKKGIHPETEFKEGNTPWLKGLTKYDDERIMRIANAKVGIPRPDMRGPNHPNWKGGYEPYYGPDWGFMNRKARQRDRGICYMCSTNEKDYSRRFDIHHIEPYRISQDNSLENLMTLCPSCHKEIENITEDS